MSRRIFAALLVGSLAPAAFGQDKATDPATPTPPATRALDDAAIAGLREGAFEAARSGEVKRLEAYFEAGQPADVANARGDHLLTLAAYHGREEAVRLILARPKVSIDLKNKAGLTALAGAAFKGHLGVAKQLVAKGADPDLADPQGRTPLMYGAMFGRSEVVRFLVESGADVSKRDAQGKTALDLAQSRGDGKAEVIKALEAAATRKP